jgi:hypothetical protein
VRIRVAMNRAESLHVQDFLRARPERFELPTFGSVDRRSIQLSYGRLRSAKPDHRSVLA